MLFVDSHVSIASCNLSTLFFYLIYLLTYRYSEIRTMQVDFACTPACRPIVLGRIPSWVNDVANGTLGHTAVTLAALILKLSELPPPPPVDPIVKLAKVTQCSGCNYGNLNIDQTIFRYCTYCNTYRNPVPLVS